MGWVRIDDMLPSHPKMAAVGPLGMALQIAGLCYANRYLTDGFIPTPIARTLIDFTDTGTDAESVIARMVEAGIWTQVEGGYQVHDYLAYQPSRAEVLAEREAAQQRMARRRHQVARASEEVLAEREAAQQRMARRHQVARASEEVLAEREAAQQRMARRHQVARASEEVLAEREAAQQRMARRHQVARASEEVLAEREAAQQRMARRHQVARASNEFRPNNTRISGVVRSLFGRSSGVVRSLFGRSSGEIRASQTQTQTQQINQMQTSHDPPSTTTTPQTFANNITTLSRAREAGGGGGGGGTDSEFLETVRNWWTSRYGDVPDADWTRLVSWTSTHSPPVALAQEAIAACERNCKASPWAYVVRYVKNHLADYAASHGPAPHAEYERGDSAPPNGAMHVMAAPVVPDTPDSDLWPRVLEALAGQVPRHSRMTIGESTVGLGWTGARYVVGCDSHVTADRLDAMYAIIRPLVAQCAGRPDADVVFQVHVRAPP